MALFTSSCQTQELNTIRSILESDKAVFGDILDMADKYRVQIIYTQIDRDTSNTPHFTTHAYRVNPQAYFYPASTVKLPAAVLTLEKLHRLNIDGLNKFTPLKIDSVRASQTAVSVDSSAPQNLPTLGHYIKKVFLVSDNDAFNRLYEFLGQRSLNHQLREKGFENVKIVHRLSRPLLPEQNRYTNPFTFYRNGEIIYEQPGTYSTIDREFELNHLLFGEGYIADDSLINRPMDFSQKNYFALPEQHEMLKSVMFPEAVPDNQRFQLTEDDYRFLWKCMTMVPRESDSPTYSPDEYYDSYVKFFIYGDSVRTIPDHIRIFNKVGLAYGFLIDNAYIVDFKNNIEFLLSAVIYVNENQILNDGNYEYDEIGLPFLANLGQAIYTYELNRDRAVNPDLSRYQM